jgi:DNA-binding transcriptional MerR regulator
VTDLINRRFDSAEQRLVQLYEPSNGQIFIDRLRLAELGVSLKDVASFLEEQPFMYAAFTEDEVRAHSGEALPTR